MQRICIYCGSAAGRDPRYREAASAFGAAVAARGLGVVYGGGATGMMGAVADAALAEGGEVVGVIPETLLAREVGHREVTRLEVVTSMHERKARMAELADGFIALPGGLGTFEEIFEILTWAQLGFHRKPCGLINMAGYYDHLVTFLDHAVDTGFLRRSNRDMLLVDDDGERLLERFAEYRAPRVTQWIDKSST
ncbi:LOG family protein YvdD [wastewater metagenome]|uniref:LOG family protein YvdD n=2 Tax=unclassified sequences TaxID=12908 RepID=A0A5B8RBV6_9ZZZZ|nr:MULTISPECIES: TIGR00730 family Rossman fold protein [Arhodomonas]MCS4503171.1 TIGR00730 family Rossman fold protein [Arhodomonas aquaeolei]QEA06599.1 LOG family protein YvdD [uncultured organism]